MFEALFILTTLDAGTRVGRYLLQGVLGRAWKPLGDPKSHLAAPVAAALMVGAWGYFLIQGVRDPLGGINSLWPLFGIANQMLAAIALCLGTTIILKMQLAPSSRPSPRMGEKVIENRLRMKPTLALITLIPLVWLLAVTFTAGVEKIGSSDPRIGFLAQAHVQSKHIEAAGAAMKTTDEVASQKASKEMKSATRLFANNMIDAAVAVIFLTLVAIIVCMSVREWFLLLSRRKAAELRETEPVWLPDYALKEPGPDLCGAAGAVALALGLAKELSGESHFERAKQHNCACEQHNDQKLFAQTTEEKFSGVRRCC
jgi:carbon starvation protein